MIDYFDSFSIIFYFKYLSIKKLLYKKRFFRILQFLQNINEAYILKNESKFSDYRFRDTSM